MMNVMVSASATRLMATAQLACGDPLLKFHRPVSEYPPSTSVTCANCGGPLHRTARGSLQTSSASARGISDAMVPRMLFWLKHHPVLPSAAAMARTIRR